MRDASLCAQHPGCMRDPRCVDLRCPEHPLLSCSTCNGGPCPTPQACLMPIAELRPITRRLFTAPRRLRLPTTRDEWGRVVMTAIGSAGLFFVFGALGRAKGWF